MVSSIIRNLKRCIRPVVVPFRSQAAILMYHRVFEPEIDLWDLSVSPAHFAEQMAVLRDQYQVLSLSDFAKHRSAGTLPKRSVVVTFDDGYLDNLVFAKPILEEYEIPATVFITTGMIGQDREYWWDELERLILLTPTESQRVQLSIEGKRYCWDLPDEPMVDVDWVSAPMQVYLEMHALIKLLPAEEIEASLASLRSQLAVGLSSRPYYRPMNQEELGQLVKGGLVELGAHTVTHPSLNAHLEAVQRTEMNQSKQWLESLLQQPVQSFAYPYGDMDQTTARVARELGFEVACTVQQGPVLKTTDAFWLNRYGVENWNGEQFAKQLHRFIN